ncbi:unnamed protein product [Ectocarpus fasciculatus]
MSSHGYHKKYILHTLAESTNPTTHVPFRVDKAITDCNKLVNRLLDDTKNLASRGGFGHARGQLARQGALKTCFEAPSTRAPPENPSHTKRTRRYKRWRAGSLLRCCSCCAIVGPPSKRGKLYRPSLSRTNSRPCPASSHALSSLTRFSAASLLPLQEG